jgi:hypothetical protein
MINNINGHIMSTTTETIVRVYTVKELAELYGISEKTFKGWLQPHADVIGKRKGWYFNTLQVRIIFSKLGEP